MIGRLTGILVGVAATAVVVDVNGVGYEIQVSPRTIAALPPVGEELVVHVHTHVREDALQLYGFATEADRNTFRVLLGASGVGPKVALAVLGSLSGDDLRRAVAAEDADALTVVPGIGKRTAQKMILELRPRFAEGEAASIGAGSTTGQVRQALESLGYAGSEIADIVAGLDPGLPVAEQIRVALRQLGSAR